MHLYIIPRGIKCDTDRFINDLQGMYLPFKFPDKDKNLQPCMVQVAVRPLQLYEVVFPEEHQDLMLNTLLQGGVLGDGAKKFNKYFYFLRKLLKIEKIPEYKTDKSMPIYHNHVECNGVGIKKDYWTNPKTDERIYNPTEEQKKECFEGL